VTYTSENTNKEMTTIRTPLSDEIREDILRFTAGEEDRKAKTPILNENRFIEVN
jgi:hypothetical protein